MTCACSGAPSVKFGAGIVSRMVRNSGSRLSESRSLPVPLPEEPGTGLVSEALPSRATA